MFDFIKNISSTELIILVLILIALFGAKVAIGLGRTGGKTVRELKNIKRDFTDAIGDDNESDKS